MLLAVPNVSEGRNARLVDRLAAGFAPARVLDIHSDPDHNRSVFWLATEQGELARALADGARVAGELISVFDTDGVHPRVGALDVAPVVYRDDAEHGPAIAEALTAATFIGELGIPVFLYGELATDPSRRERAALRRGGPDELARRLSAGELAPDYGPAELHPRAGAVLVTARPPLVAFNVNLAEGDLATAQRIARELREDGGGPSGVRALGLWLESSATAQVSMNVHDYRAAPLGAILATIRRHAAVSEAELVGLAPAAALADFPADVPLRNRRTIEDALDAPN